MKVFLFIMLSCYTSILLSQNSSTKSDAFLYNYAIDSVIVKRNHEISFNIVKTTCTENIWLKLFVFSELSNSDSLQLKTSDFDSIVRINSKSENLKGKLSNRNDIVFIGKSGEKYPRKIYSFSKIHYFHDFAFVYITSYCGDLCGEGVIVYFKRSNYRWLLYTI